MALQNFNAAICFQLKMVQQKFTSVYPIKRQKRGLINGLGSIIKSISGNLDQEDADRFNQAIRNLQENQNNIANKLNQEISLTTKIIDNFNHTITLVLHNQDVIANGIECIKKDLNKFIFEFNDYLQVKNILDQLNLSLNIIIQLLTDIENAITFAKLNTLHHSIVKIDELEFIVDTLRNNHPVEQLLYTNKIDIHKYYEIVEVKAYYSENKIIFALEFPLIHPEHFSYYHLYSIPTPNHTTIIPSNTYLTMSDNFYQYQSTPCKEIDAEYYCQGSLLIDGWRQNDCIFQLLQLSQEDNTCTQVPVRTVHPIVEQITETYYIGIFPNETKIQITCRTTDFTILRGTYLFELPPKCNFKTSEYTYSNEKEAIKGQPLLLPEIKTMRTKTNITRELKLEDVSLDKLHTLKREQESMEPIHLKEDIETAHYWTAPLYIIFIIIVSVFAVHRLRKCKSSRHTPQVSTTPAEGQSKDKGQGGKVLFVPNKTSV